MKAQVGRQAFLARRGDALAMGSPGLAALVVLAASAAAAPAVAGLLPDAPSLPSAGVLAPGQRLEVVAGEFRADPVLVAFALAGPGVPEPPAHWVLVFCGWASCRQTSFDCLAGTIVVPPSYFDAYVGLDLVAEQATTYAFATETAGEHAMDTCGSPPP